MNRNKHLYEMVINMDQSKGDEMGEGCRTHGRDERCLQNFGRKTWREDIHVDGKTVREY